MAIAEQQSNVSQPKPYRVLTIDGGGMRGLYTAMLLETLATRFAQQKGENLALDVGKAFDLIVGTSTGAILAIALMLGIPTREVVRLYREVGPKVFCDPVPSDYQHRKGMIALWKWVWRNWKKPANDSQVLRESLKPFFKEVTLQEVYDKRGIALCVAAVNMGNHQGVVFKTPHNPLKKRDARYSVLDVCIASIAAPILFPLTAIDDPEDPVDYKVFVDGGLWANNPVLIGMLEALQITKADRPIEILSLSACKPAGGTFIPKQQANWGLREWRAGTRVLSLALEVQSSAYYEMANLFSGYLKQPCTVIRLPQTTPSSEQERHILMDQATPYSMKILSSLAKQDAETTYRYALERRNSEYVALLDMFTSMPSHPNNTGTHQDIS